MKSLEATAPYNKVARHNLAMEKYLQFYRPKVAGKATYNKNIATDGSGSIKYAKGFDLEEAEAASRYVSDKLIKIHDDDSVGDFEFASRDLIKETEIIAEE